MARAGSRRVRQRSIGMISDHIWKVPVLMMTFAFLHPFLLSLAVDAEGHSPNNIRNGNESIYYGYAEVGEKSTFDMAEWEKLGSDLSVLPQTIKWIHPDSRTCMGPLWIRFHYRDIRRHTPVVDDCSYALSSLRLLLLLGGDIERNPGPETSLSTDHYQVVRKALLRVRPQWRNIGLALGIPLYKLNEFSGSSEERMDKMLEVWLDHTYTTPTWGALVTALRDDTVVHGKPVAAEIEKNYMYMCGGGEESVPETPSLKDRLECVPPEKLDQPCSDDHLNKIALSLTDWKSIAPFLGLTEDDEVEIKRDYPNIKTQRIAMLRKWKKSRGKKAKYRRLVSVFWDLERTDLVEKVCELLQTEISGSSSDEDDYAAKRRQSVGQEFPPEKLDQPFRDGHVSELALSITNWESIGLFLGLTEAEMEEIEQDHAKRMTQRIGMLWKWKRKFGREATYRKLLSVFRKLKQPDLVEDVCEILRNSHPNSSDISASERSSVAMYTEYLRGRYSTEVPEFFALQWPPPPTKKVFKLAIIKLNTIQRGLIDEELVRQKQMGSVDDIMKRKSSIELENLFKLDNYKRKIILIEGAPGAGKSTLAWDICQRWQSGELFQEFKVVVFAHLRDPAIQSAMSLADILPAESDIMRKNVMSDLHSCRGHDVLFVLDGWDEYMHREELCAPSPLRQLIYKPAKVSMHFSSLIITSRPIASGELQRYASSRVEILGFTSDDVKKYFCDAIGDSETEQKLHDHLTERPVIEASCYLPLNAAIVAHLFLALNHTLPHTLHEVFQSLVLCCIIRHLSKEAEGGEMTPHTCIPSLDDLPLEVQEPFNNICTMAYHGVMDNQATFSAADLQSFNAPTELSTLGLIQGVQSFVVADKLVSCNFLHLSVQELLAAFHISKLSASEQTQIFDGKFSQPRLAAVFRFYAAFTKLQTEGVKSIVARIVQKEMKSLSDRPLLINLLHCLYEAQDPSLCEFVASHLNGKLDLHRNTLSPMACLVVGYFISGVWLGEFKANLSHCSLDDYRVRFLVKDFCYSRLHTLILSGNNLSDGGVAHIARGLRHNNCLKTLDISYCEFGDCGMESLARALEVNTSLEELDMRWNDGIITAVGLMMLGESLKRNRVLKTLKLSGDYNVSYDEWKEFVLCLQENSHLTKLHLYFMSEMVACEIESVNHIRTQKDLPLLEVVL